MSYTRSLPSAPSGSRVRRLARRCLLTGLCVALALSLACGVWLFVRARADRSLAATALDLRADIGALGRADFGLADPQAWDSQSVALRQRARTSLEEDLAAMRHSGLGVPGVARVVAEGGEALDSYLRLEARAGAVQPSPGGPSDPAVAELTAVAQQNGKGFERAWQDAAALASGLSHSSAVAGLWQLVGIASVAGLLVALAFVVVVSRGRRETAALAASERRTQIRFEAMIEHASDLTALTDRQGRFLYVSPSVVRLLGYPAEEFQTILQAGVLRPGDVDLLQRLMGAAEASGHAGPEKLPVRHADGSRKMLSIRVDDLTELDEVGAMLWTARDVTDQVLLEAELARQAFEDSLTGLANRALFRDRLDHAVARAVRDPRALAVLLADLDGFKKVNDSLGHDAGDAVLVEVAGRLRTCLRPADTVARMGGDEFTVLLESVPSLAHAEEIAGRVEAVLRRPITVGSTELHIGVSIGIAYSENGSETAQELLRNADMAMYAAKSAGKGRWATFEPAMFAELDRELFLTTELREAIRRSELDLHYQPTYELATGQVIGAEALLRWRHRSEGVIAPSVFIPLAEQSGFIVELGRWAFERACRQAAAWHARLPDAAPLMVAVNLSARQLADAALVDDVVRVLACTGLDPGALMLEITEGELMQDVDSAARRLTDLKALGVRLAIDDFGTGYSSLAYLRQFPVDILKIDQSFVQGAASGAPGSQALVQAIIDMAASLGMGTIAEGVETRAQADQLCALGCRLGQGYLFARPMPGREFDQFLGGHLARPAALWAGSSPVAVERPPHLNSQQTK